MNEGHAVNLKIMSNGFNVTETAYGHTGKTSFMSYVIFRAYFVLSTHYQLEETKGTVCLHWVLCLSSLYF